MMEDTKSKNYNSILVSLVSELLFENDNSEIGREVCYSYIVNDLKIKLQKDVFINIIEKSKNFIHTPSKNDVDLRLTDNKFKEINENVRNHSLDSHIINFLKEKGLPQALKSSIESLLYQAIYENINSFTIQNIDSIIPKNANKTYSAKEIEAFNDFLSESNKEKNASLFNSFLKAVEFAIITSGKGVNEFTKGVFEGKEYLLDTNIIFRLLGVGGNERQESLINLIEQCNHQGIKFYYSHQSHLEFKRKIESSLIDLTRGTENKSIKLLQEMLEEDSSIFDNGFITHYAQLRIEKSITSPEKYKLKLLTDFKSLCRKYDISLKQVKGDLKQSKIESLETFLFKKKRNKNGYTTYTKTAAKVDAINVLSVRNLRGNNNYNYSDIKSFYLTTDRTLNSILAKEAGDRIAETILPSQLYILHNSLSDEVEDEEKDYEAFTKFLKRRTTEFKYSGKQVLSYIEEIRSHTSEPENIKEILKSYSDLKYDSSLADMDVEPMYMSFQDFVETHIDRKLKKAEVGEDRYNKALDKAVGEFPKFLSSSKLMIQIIDVVIYIFLIPITVLLVKSVTDNLFFIIVAVIIVEIIKLVLSSRLNVYSDWTRQLFMRKAEKSSYHQTFKSVDRTYIDKAKNFVKDEINIWR